MHLMRLQYIYKHDTGLKAQLMGSPEAIRDLYVKLTKQYAGGYNNEIEVKIFSLDGDECNIKEFMQYPHQCVYPHTNLD